MGNRLFTYFLSHLSGPLSFYTPLENNHFLQHFSVSLGGGIFPLSPCGRHCYLSRILSQISVDFLQNLLELSFKFKKSLQNLRQFCWSFRQVSKVTNAFHQKNLLNCKAPPSIWNFQLFKIILEKFSQFFYNSFRLLKFFLEKLEFWGEKTVEIFEKLIHCLILWFILKF